MTKPDLRRSYDRAAMLEDGIVFIKDNLVQVWTDGEPSTLTFPSCAAAGYNFSDMVFAYGDTNGVRH